MFLFQFFEFHERDFVGFGFHLGCSHQPGHPNCRAGSDGRNTGEAEPVALETKKALSSSVLFDLVGRSGIEPLASTV